MGILRQLTRSVVLASLSLSAHSFLPPGGVFHSKGASLFLAMSTASTTSVPSWTDLVEQSAATPVGKALNKEVSLRKEGKGSASRENTLRTFGRDGDPIVTLYR